MRPFQELLEHVCLRPEMYVAERRFRTVAAWLDGYNQGLHQSTDVSNRPIGLDGFRLWLSEKFWASHGIERNLGWWGYFVRLYPEDEEALKHLPILYGDYVRQQSGTAPA